MATIQQTTTTAQPARLYDSRPAAPRIKIVLLERLSPISFRCADPAGAATYLTAHGWRLAKTVGRLERGRATCGDRLVVFYDNLIIGDVEDLAAGVGL